MEVRAAKDNMVACVFLFGGSGTLFDIFCPAFAKVHGHIYEYECTEYIQHPKVPSS